MNPCVSVIIPAYNHENYIRAAIQSVLDQSLADWELIVIDDGSTDATFEHIRTFADPRITTLTQANQDAYNTINRGMQMARGEYLAILNSDDLFMPDRLERLIHHMRSRQLDCAFSNVQPMDNKGRDITDPDHHWNRWHNANRAYLPPPGGNLLPAFLHGNLLVTTSNLVIAARAAKEIGPFAPIRYLHDYDYILRAIRHGGPKVGHLDEKLVRYRLHKGNTLKKGAIEARLQDIKLIREHTLLAIPEAQRECARIGIERLLGLERELHAVRYARKHPLRHYAGLLLRELRARTRK